MIEYQVIKLTFQEKDIMNRYSKDKINNERKLRCYEKIKYHLN